MELDCSKIPQDELEAMDAIMARLTAEIRSSWTPLREAEASGRLPVSKHKRFDKKKIKTLYEHDGRLFQFADPEVYSLSEPNSPFEDQ
jgi:hypothetical protein